MVAWEWMRSYPDDICGATLINTSFADLSPFLSAATLAKLWKIYCVNGDKRFTQTGKQGILQLVSNRRDQDEQVMHSLGKDTK